MKHLSEQQLLALFYERESLDPADCISIEKHLQSCTACRQKLDEFEQTAKLLDASEITTPSRAFKLETIAQAHGSEPSFSNIGPRPVTYRALLAIAASSILVFVAAVGFTAGTISQANRSEAHFERRLEEVASQLDKDILQKVALRMDPANAKLSELENRFFERLNEAIAGANRSSSREAAQVLNEIEPHLVRLIDEQRRLRRDLESLAINAEFVITDSQQEMDRRISELTSHIRTPSE